MRSRMAGSAALVMLFFFLVRAGVASRLLLFLGGQCPLGRHHGATFRISDTRFKIRRLNRGQAGQSQYCNKRKMFHGLDNITGCNPYLVIEKVCSTGSALFNFGSVERPNCHATTVTLTGNLLRGGICVNRSVLSLSISAGPSRT